MHQRSPYSLPLRTRVYSPARGRSAFRATYPLSYHSPALLALRAGLLASLVCVGIIAAGYVAGYYLLPVANAGTPSHARNVPLPYPAGFPQAVTFARA